MTVENWIKSISKRLSRLMWPQEQRMQYDLSDLAIILPELNEISEILEGRLYLSGCLPVTRKNLHALGITAVVYSMTEEEERKNRPYLDGKFRRMCIRLKDLESSDLSSFFPSVTRFIDGELNRGGKVLVHCVAGVSRSVTLTLAYLIKYNGYNSKDAYLLVKAKRSIARPNDEFCRQIVQYETSLGKRRRNSSYEHSLDNRGLEMLIDPEPEPVAPIAMF